MSAPGKTRSTLVPSARTTFPVSSFGLPQVTVETLLRLARSERGCLILLHGVAETGKTSLAVSLSDAVAKVPSFLSTGVNETAEDIQVDLDELLEMMDYQSRTLVIDDDEDFLHSKSPFNESFQQVWLDNFASRNRKCIIWITNDTTQIPNKVLALFDYTLELVRKIGSQFVWPSIVPSSWHGPLKRFVSLSPVNLRKAVDVWYKTSRVDDHPEFSLERLIDLLTRWTREGGRSEAKSRLAPISCTFDPSLWNTDVPLVEISDTVGRYLAWIKRNPDQRQPFAILASGPPGTGKTEFAKFLAKEHGSDLKVYRYSDLVSPLVGATEQEIGKVFAESAPGDFLLLDEVDSLLASRAQSKNSWERTTTNEILTQLENFPGVVVACTNLLAMLDSAVARRFIAKITFNALRVDQVAKAWEAHFPGIEHPTSGLEELAGLATPGDFRIIANGLQFQERQANTTEVLEKLRFEQQVKRKLAGLNREVGFRG